MKKKKKILLNMTITITITITITHSHCHCHRITLKITFGVELYKNKIGYSKVPIL